MRSVVAQEAVFTRIPYESHRKHKDKPRHKPKDPPQLCDTMCADDGGRCCPDGSCVDAAACCYPHERTCADGSCAPADSCCYPEERTCGNGTCIPMQQCCGGERLCPNGACLPKSVCCDGEQRCADGSCVCSPRAARTSTSAPMGRASRGRSAAKVSGSATAMTSAWPQMNVTGGEVVRRQDVRAQGRLLP